jgi:hypothetical protein
MCTEMELEDEEAKDFIQRQRSQWKELARHPDRIEIVIETFRWSTARSPVGEPYPLLMASRSRSVEPMCWC